MARLRRPDPRITAASAHLVELVTVCHHDGPDAAGRHARTLTDAEARTTLALAVGALHGAVVDMADMIGADPVEFIRAFGMAIAADRCGA